MTQCVQPTGMLLFHSYFVSHFPLRVYAIKVAKLSISVTESNRLQIFLVIEDNIITSGIRNQQNYCYNCVTLS
jgi:hypothetical protein